MDTRPVTILQNTTTTLAVNTSVTYTPVDIGWNKRIAVILNVSAFSGAGTLAITIQHLADNETWTDCLRFANILTSASNQMYYMPTSITGGISATNYKAVLANAGTDVGFYAPQMRVTATATFFAVTYTAKVVVVRLNY